MINKLLCFMFGHVFEEITGLVTVIFANGEKFGDFVTVRKCKFCNAREP